MIVGAADRQVAVSQAGCAHEAGLLALPAAAVEPNALIAAERAQAEFAADRQMSRMDLVARKHDARKLDPERSSSGARSLEIGAKGFHVAPVFQAIEMREGMRADLLCWIVEDSPDKL